MQSEDGEVIAPGHLEAPTTPADVAKRCVICNSNLSEEDLDLESVAKYLGQIGLERSWEKGVQGGCMFCRLITAVSEDAKQRYRLKEDKHVAIAPTRNGQYLLYFYSLLLALPHVLPDPLFAMIYVYREDISPSSLLKRYKPIPRQATDPACLGLAKQWLSTCQNGHQQCNEKFDMVGPSRLVDLQGDVIKLVSFLEGSARGPYVALSHCWGDAQPLQTTSVNLVSFQTQIPVTQLPQTFLDAIYVTRALGFAYIWIDSLCIVQDDASDWEQQSSVMASIYSNADLVLAGAAAGSANEGFLRKERQSCEGTVSLDIRGSQASFVYTVVPQHHHEVEEPLYKRGWTLQERLCARRFLAYGNWEMSWECKQSSCCEIHENDLGDNSTSRLHRSFGDKMETTGQQDFTGLWWDEVVQPYSQRLLTKATDVPVAISALAARFQSRFNGTYLAGLWEEDLCSDLLWFSDVLGRPSSICAPSWSWMSLEMPRRIHSLGAHSLGKTLVSIVQTKVMPSTTNPYGPVSSGTIRLTGILIPASLEAGPSREDPWENMNLSTSRHDISDAESWIDTPIVRTDARLMDGTEESTTRRAWQQEEGLSGSYPISLLLVLKHRGGVVGLLLGRSATCVGAYERIGVFQYLSEDVFESMRKEYDMCDVTLV